MTRPLLAAFEAEWSKVRVKQAFLEDGAAPNLVALALGGIGLRMAWVEDRAKGKVLDFRSSLNMAILCLVNRQASAHGIGVFDD